jgi:lipopolysaccharide transport system ATP-binding protein
MSDVAVRVVNVGKQYRIGARQERYKTLRDIVSDGLRAPVRRLRSRSLRRSSSEDMIWALRDVSFTIRPGEVVGLIGRNGAGKTTLLKVLSRITDPTVGHAEIHGRVGSLLEVGTGFHPELSGRENIYLNGAILGMKRTEIDRRFDQIVAFAEVDRFLDTPVKYYSSGMHVRLAFAVAAHLEPEILLVDEVLAVGDARFQKKCLGRMQDVSTEGRTVLFVSHSMPAITRLCQRAILLEAGQIVQDGPAGQVAGKYLQSDLGTSAARVWPDADESPGNDIVRLRSVHVRSEGGLISEVVDIRQPVYIEMEYEVLTPGHVLVPNYHMYNEEGACVFVTAAVDSEWRRKPRPVGRYTSSARIPGNYLSEGFLVVSADIHTHDPLKKHFHEADVVAFRVVDTLEGNSARGDYAGPMPGVVRPLLRWQTEFTPEEDSP